MESFNKLSMVLFLTGASGVCALCLYKELANRPMGHAQCVELVVQKAYPLENAPAGSEQAAYMASNFLCNEYNNNPSLILRYLKLPENK